MWMLLFVCLLCFVFETATHCVALADLELSYINQADKELTVYTRLPSDLPEIHLLLYPWFYN